jgi:hypothetical protein
MAKSSNPKRKKAAKTVLKLPDLEQSKSAVLNSLVSSSSQRSYDHAIREFIEWYCSEPRLAFNKTVVTRYRIALEQKHYAPSTIRSVGNPGVHHIGDVVSIDQQGGPCVGYGLHTESDLVDCQTGGVKQWSLSSSAS